MNQSFKPALLRRTVLDMAYSGGTVHIGCSFSIIELLAVLYRSFLRFPSGHPDDPTRDYFVLSKGHGVMALYACLHEQGWLSDQDIAAYFKDDTKLKGLGDVHVRGVEVTGGSLGHGLSIAAGLALAAKRLDTDQYCYVLIGDGEANEGSIWEALLFAQHFKLDNLVVLVDKNDFQAMGATDDVIALGNIEAKLASFGFDACTIDGHDEEQIESTIRMLRGRRDGRPKAIVARTVKGKGVSFMEANNMWHYTRLTPETYAAAKAELDLL